MRKIIKSGDATRRVPLVPGKRKPAATIGTAGFRVDSIATANALLKELSRVETAKARELVRHNTVLALLDAKEKRLLVGHLSQLESWAREVIAGTPRRSLKLKYGLLAFRMVAASVRIVDSEAAAAYARSKHPRMLVRVVTTKLDHLKYRAWAMDELRMTGVPLPGIGCTNGHETFSYKLGA